MNNKQIEEEILKEVSDQDSWCAFCKNGLETGEDFCEECETILKKAISLTLSKQQAEIIKKIDKFMMKKLDKANKKKKYHIELFYQDLQELKSEIEGK